MVILYRRFGTTYRSHFQGSRSPRLELLDALRCDPVGYPETSVQNYHYRLRNIPEERISHLNRGGSLKSRIIWKPPNRGSDLFVFENELPDLQDKLHTEECRIGYKPKFIRERGWKFSCSFASNISNQPLWNYPFCRNSVIYTEAKEKIQMGEALHIPSTGYVSSFCLPPSITLQSRCHCIHTNVGSDSHMTNFLNNKFFGVVEIGERRGGWMVIRR